MSLNASARTILPFCRFFAATLAGWLCASTPQTALAHNLGTELIINEIKYRGANNDARDSIEVVGPPLTDFPGYSFWFYDGASGLVYDDWSPPVVSMDDRGIFVLTGRDDSWLRNVAGIAVVNGEGEALEFFSWGGTITAVDGPAAGLTSYDIGVVMPEDATGTETLQRVGVGSTTLDFTWSGPTHYSFNYINEGQVVTYEEVPADPEEQVADLAEDVDLNAPSDNNAKSSMLAALDVADFFLAKGNTEQALAALGRFIDRVDHFRSKGLISAEQADAWLTAAEETIAAL